MALATAAGHYLFWIASRAAGISRAAAVQHDGRASGLLMGGRIVKRRRRELRVDPRGAVARDARRAASSTA